MILEFEERSSNSPFVERIWRSQSRQGGSFISMALSHWQMSIWTINGQTHVTVRGPETRPTLAYAPPHEDFIGIVFKLGAVMPPLPASHIVDSEITLPTASDHTFWLNGAAWQFPTYDNADIFVERLVRDNLLVKETVVDDVLGNHPLDLSQRSVQRRFLHATGMTQGTALQIDRARQATMLLKQGVSILDTVAMVGYADQPHLTRSLKRFVGLTPAQLNPSNNPQQLSFLFDS